MTRSLLPIGVMLWAGLVLVFSELRWFRRPTLATRLRPYRAHGSPHTERTAATWRTALGPSLERLGDRLGRALGLSDDLDRRLRRTHSALDPSGFRLRQLGWALVGLTVGTGSALLLSPPPITVPVLVLIPPAIAVLVVEQELLASSARWRRDLRLELPVVSEQLGMLLSAGYSLGGALNRLAERGAGVCARDLDRVRLRIQHGLTEIDALTEWAELADVDALDRLVAVLAFNREASDLGQLISTEAAAIRAEVHRQTLEQIERRNQQVWIPVTVATLLPGVLFLAVPFVEAMQVFSDG